MIPVAAADTRLLGIFLLGACTVTIALAIAPVPVGFGVLLLAGVAGALWVACHHPEIFLVLAIWTSVVPTVSVFNVGGLSVAPYMICEGLAFAGWVLRDVLKRQRFIAPVGMGFLALHAGCSAASLLIAEDFRLAITPFLRVALQWLMVVLLVALIEDRQRLERLGTALLLQAVVVVGISVGSSLQNLDTPGFRSVLSNQFQKNDYATYLAFVTMLSLGVLGGKGRPLLDRCLAIVTLGLAGLSWPLTYSRSGLVAIVVALLTLVFLSRSAKLLRFLLLSVTLFVIGFTVLPERVREIATQAIRSMNIRDTTDTSSFGKTIDERVTLNRAAFRQIADTPLLGIGFNQWILHSPLEVQIWDIKRQEPTVIGTIVHNRYLLVAVESGVPALVGYLGFVYVLLACARRLRRDADHQMRLMLSVMIATASGYLASNLFIPGTLWEWPMLAVLAATVRVARRERKARRDVTFAPAG